MATSTSKATVRRAVPMDVVNICRLISEDRKHHLFVEPDEGLALAFVLGLITKGYVAVAEHTSGRIVGVIAFGPYIPGFSNDPIFDCEFFVIAPSFKDTGIGLALLRRSIKVADGYNAPVRISVCNWPDDKRAERWYNALGFEAAVPTWLRKPQKNKDNESGRRQDNETDDLTEPVVRGSGKVGAEPSDGPIEPTV